MTRLHHDFEWYSELDVTKYGVSRTTRHPSCEALMCAYAFDDGSVQQWVPEEGESMPADLRDAITDPHVTKIAWNKPAEWCVWTHVLGIETPHSEWKDAMVLAMSLSFPGKLARVGPIMKLPDRLLKMSSGTRLINLFSKPQKPSKKHPYRRRGPHTDPEAWEEFKLYNRTDVESERAIWNKCKRWDMSDDEWALFSLDQEINEAGMPVNLNVVENAIRVAEAITSLRRKRMADESGLANPNSVQQLLPWLRDQGYPFDDLKKGHVSRALEIAQENDMDEGYISVLEMRQEVSKASVKKFAALKRATDEDGMLRYSLQFVGAQRTGRWAGRVYQPQNLARPAKWLEKTQAEAVRDLEYLDAECIEWLYKRPMDLLSTCVRPVVQATDGNMLVDADLNAIENRVLGWLARDRKILEVFEKGRDPYVDFATYMYGEPYDKLFAEYKNGDSSKRTVAKPGVLGCGYMLGPGEERENPTTGEIEATGLLGYGRAMGVKLTPEQAKLSVEVWRETFSDAVSFWWAISRAAMATVRTGNSYDADRVRFDVSGPFLRMILPSGRCLFYYHPLIQDRATPWGEVKPTLTYEGLNVKGHWARLTTHPGKLTENADQAISRDLLAHGIKLAKQRGLDVRLHVHDQIVALSLDARASKDLDVLKECMTTPPKWAQDCPLGSAGFVSKIFVKD